MLSDVYVFPVDLTCIDDLLLHNYLCSEGKIEMHLHTVKTKSKELVKPANI